MTRAETGFVLCAWMVAGIVSCCHVDRLADLPRPLERVELALEVEQAPSVHFTHQSLMTYRRPGPVHGHAEGRYGRVLEAFGPDALSASLVEQAPGVVQQRLGWQAASERHGADATLSLQIEGYYFSALDAISELEIKWKIRAYITTVDTEQVMWRICREWSSGPLGETMEGLARKEPSQHQELLDELARKLLQDLAAAVTRDREKAGHRAADGRNET